MMTPGFLTAFVVGCTGEVGKAIVKELASHSQFAQITLILRRRLELPMNDIGYEKIEQEIIDFENLSNFKNLFEGHDVGFCALGTTQSKAGGKDGFYRVDHDYVVECAKLAKNGGCKHFHLVSSARPNKNSIVYYSKIKGQVEEEIISIGFERLSIYRPGLLLCNRTEVRTGEKVVQFLFKPLDHWRHLSIDVSVLANAMMKCCFTLPPTNSIEILENRAINSLGINK